MSLSISAPFLSSSPRRPASPRRARTRSHPRRRQSSNGDESRPSGQGDVFKVSTTGALMQRMGGPNSRAFRASLERAPRRSIEALDPAIVGSLPQRGASVGRGQDARRADHPMKGIEETEEKDQDRLDRRKDPPARAASGVLTTAHNAAALSRRVASRGALYSGMVPSEGDPDSDSEAPAGDPREKQSNGAAVPPIFAEDSAPKARILGLVGSEGRAKTSKVSARERERELPLWRRFAGVVASHWAMRALNMAGVLCLTVVLMLYRPTEAADSNWNR